MVAREVAEDDGVEVDAGGAVLGEGVRADLESARLVAGLDHLAEHALQVERLGGRELDRVVAPPMRLTTVPSSAAGTPAAAKMPATRCAVVVLPLVPVTPTTVRSRDGSPYQRAAMSAMARRTDGTTHLRQRDAPVARSQTSAAAPAAAARAANSCPSKLSPGTQKKSVPSATSRVW